MTDKSVLTAYATRLGDNALILGQRMIELVAGSPELEEELANANFALDYIGQARMLYSYAAEREGCGKTVVGVRQERAVGSREGDDDEGRCDPVHGGSVIWSIHQIV